MMLVEFQAQRFLYCGYLAAQTPILGLFLTLIYIVNRAKKPIFWGLGPQRTKELEN